MESPPFRLSQGAYNLLVRLQEEEAVSYHIHERWNDEDIPFDEQPTSSHEPRFDPPGVTSEGDVVGDDRRKYRQQQRRAASKRARSQSKRKSWWEANPDTFHGSSSASASQRGRKPDTVSSSRRHQPQQSQTDGSRSDRSSQASQLQIVPIKKAHDRSDSSISTRNAGSIPAVINYQVDRATQLASVVMRPEDSPLNAPTYTTAPDNESSGEHSGSSFSGLPSRTKINFLDDDHGDMTYGRRIALWMMQRSSWYYPRLRLESSRRSTKWPTPDEMLADGGRYRSPDGYPRSHSGNERPSLAKAWAYFEHVTLTRHFHVPKEEKNIPPKSLPIRIIRKLFYKGDKQLARAEPGEVDRPTRMYHPFFTPFNQLGDFGLGVGLYFASIRGLTILVLLAGTIHVPNFIYFGGASYSNYQKDVNPLQKGSAICTKTEWVLCPTCTPDDFPEFNKGETWLHDPNHNLTIARKNLCDGATLQQGFVNFTGFLFICLASVFLNFYLTSMEKTFDEDEQTSQDYSIVVENPPHDAKDPEEWRNFFKAAFNAHVTGCTVAVHNDRLVRTLVERREKMRLLESWVEPGTKLDLVTLAGIATEREKKRSIIRTLLVGKTVWPGFPEIFARLAVLTARVQGLAQQEYPVTKVFITFETEGSQREVLQTLCVSKHQVARNKLRAVPDIKFVFRGKHLLSVKEPEEPDSIRWENLNASSGSLFKQQLYTALATAAALFVVAIVVNVVHQWNAIFTAYTIAITNVLFPAFAKLLTRFEAHPTYGSLQTSMYFKIALFRWVSTAIVITLITPFTDTLRNGTKGLIVQIQAQFFAEISTVAAIQIVDPIGNFRRHVLAPRAKTQDEMNLHMKGTQVELAERYTSISKLLFLTFWYCSIFPMTFFICAFALQVIYFMDRFSLTRTWKRLPRLGSRISKFNRAYFLPLSIVAMGIMSSYFWSGFPYDNLCEVEDAVTQNTTFYSIPVSKQETGGGSLDYFSILDYYTGDQDNATEVEVVYVNVTVEAGKQIYKHCNQDMLRTPGRQTYPFVPIFQKEGEEWMTEEQEVVTTYFGWLSFFLSVGWLVIIVFTWAHNLIFGYFMAHYKANGDDQQMNFSELESINIYIPEIKSPVISYPLLAANVDGIDPEVFEWTDAEHPHAYYDLTKDAEALVKDRGECMTDKVVFSQVAHWPPTREDNSTLETA